MARSNVPSFGDWENEENYTAYFEKASKGRSGAKIINPNDPQENVRATAIKPGAKPEAAVIPGAARSKHERRSSREDGDLRRSTDPPARTDNLVRRTSTDSHRQRNGDSRTGRQSGGSSIEQSPIHPHQQARVSGKGSGVPSPSSDRKGSSEHNQGLAPTTPGRPRQRSATRADGTPDRGGATVPKFGEWNENPASADGYTQKFDVARGEKQGGSAKVPVLPTESSFNGHQKNKNDDDSTAICCFAWGRKRFGL